GAAVFAGWTGACTGTSTCNLTIGSAATNVGAAFSAPLTLTVMPSGSGSGTITSSDNSINCGTTCSASYSSGTIVNLTAAAAAGSTFTGWTGACSGAANCSVTINAAQSVGATFASTSFPVNVTFVGTGGGSVASAPAGINCNSSPCSANFGTGAAVTLTAAP